MKRVLEPELMEDDGQALAYAKADFEEAHSSVIALHREYFDDPDFSGHAIDLGCGTADITIRFARAYPECVVHGVDGSEAMLRYGRELVSAAGDVSARIVLVHGRLPDANMPRQKYDAVISNSLLHHLPDPDVIWAAVKRFGAVGAPVLVVDLMRPSSPERARELVEMYSPDEPEVLKRDFYNSLCAAFELDEVREQLARGGLKHFSAKAVSDRHLVVAGYIR